MDRGLLFELLSCPTAPFRESHVASFVIEFLKKHQLSYFVDPVGNIIVGTDSHQNYLKKVTQKSEEPLRFFIAHMDHPGFHGVKWVSPKVLSVKWYGGTPRRFLNGARVWLSVPHDGRVSYRGEGVLRRAKLNNSKSALESSEVVIKKWYSKESPSLSSAQELFGGFAFKAPVWEKNKVVYTKAADDLVGVFAILKLALKFKDQGSRFLGLISRAEEVGFIGTIGHLELGWLESHRDSVVVISLETSRTLPGALVGKGPIVRLGDRATPFDPGLTQILTEVAQTKLTGKFQRRIMDGGTCEATAATAFGFRAMGISIPLGNYHNQSFEGGPQSRGEWGPAPEFVHLDDVRGMLVLCQGLMEQGLPWTEPWKKRKTSFLSSRKEAETLLKLV